MGYLYVIKSLHNPELYKIGITSNWDKRAQQLYVNQKTALHLLCQFTDDCEKLAEKELHKYYKYLRLPQSEWFFFDSEKLEQLNSVFKKCAIDKYDGTVVLPFSNCEEKVLQQECCDEGESLRRSFSEEELRDLEADDWSGEGEETFFMAKEHNPFLLDFYIETDEDLELGPYICVEYAQPNNVIGVIKFGFNFCPKAHELNIIFLGSSNHGGTPADNDDWFAKQYPWFDENDLDCNSFGSGYLENLYGLLGTLSQIPEPEWPFLVRKEVFEQEAFMRRLLAQGLI